MTSCVPIAPVPALYPQGMANSQRLNSVAEGLDLGLLSLAFPMSTWHLGDKPGWGWGVRLSLGPPAAALGNEHTDWGQKTSAGCFLRPALGAAWAGPVRGNHPAPQKRRKKGERGRSTIKILVYE